MRWSNRLYPMKHLTHAAKFLPIVALSALIVSCQAIRTKPAPQPASVAPAPAAAAQPTTPFWPADGKFPGRGEVSGWKDFPKHNAARRALFASEKAADQDGLVFVGDSITEGWGALLQQDFGDLGVKVVNRGIGGDTTPNLLYRLQDDVLSLHPRGLVILIGTNDLGQHTAPADIAANLKDLLAQIRAAYPNIPIAWCLVMPRGDGDRYPAEIRELNGLIKQLAQTDPHVTVCDTYTPLATADGKDIPADFKPDNLHLNPAGYAVWNAALHPILETWHLRK